MKETHFFGSKGTAVVRRTLTGYEVQYSREFRSNTEATKLSLELTNEFNADGVAEARVGVAEIAEACAAGRIDEAHVLFADMCEYIVELTAKSHPAAKLVLEARKLLSESRMMAPLACELRSAADQMLGGKDGRAA